jgi:hypothetical protein
LYTSPNFLIFYCTPTSPSLSPLKISFCRDLIASADTIVGIADHTIQVTNTLDELEQKLDSLSAQVEAKQSTAASENVNEASSSYDKLFAIGSRIKYLIDSPETIYGCLDAREFLAAAQRYVRAMEVHKSFTTNFKQSAKRFPLLRHHWPLVKKLGTETWDRAVEWLKSQGGATPAQLAGVLAAMALLKPVDGAEVLKHHLAARQAYIISCLSAALANTNGDNSNSSNNESIDPDELAVVLADVASLVCSTVAQCGELFLSRPGITARPLLSELAGRDDMGTSELLFDPGSGGTDHSTEAAAWKKHQSAVCDRLGALSSAGVALECSQWLEGLATQVAPLCEKLLENCDSGAALHRVEVGVQDALSSWRYNLNNNTQSSSGSGVKSDGGNDRATTISNSTSASEELSWTDACQWVVGHPVSLWPLLLEGPLVSRAKGLVAAQFTAVGDQAGELIQAALTESYAMPPCTPGKVDHGKWSDTLELAHKGLATSSTAAAAAVGVKRKISGGSGGVRGRPDSSLSNTAGVASTSDPCWWLTRAESLLQAIDSNLDAALSAALAVTEAGAGAGGSASVSAATSREMLGSSASVASSSVGPSPRAVMLQPFVQETCSAAVDAVAAALAAAAASFDTAAAKENSDFDSAACAALFVGRVAQGLAERSAPLRLLLGPPAAWAAARTARARAQPLQRMPSATATAAAAAALRSLEVAPRLDAAQRRLHSIAIGSYTRWAIWASRGLAEQLVIQAAADGALASDAPLRGWEEAILPGGGDSSTTTSGDVKFMLPALPSPTAMATALGACSEIERAGGHAADRVAVQLLRWYLAGDVSSALKAAFATGGPFSTHGSVSEKGLLQLLFDLRFLTTLLEAVPPPTSQADGGAAMPTGTAAARLREIASAESELASHIDPIDWATYEAHLYSRVSQFSQSSKALLGLAMRGAPAPKSVAGSGATPATPTQPTESNILRMATPGARFSYLPVNTPAALRQQQQQQRQQVATPAAAAALLDDGPETQYSFAALTTGRSRPSSAASGPGGRDNNAAGGAAGVGAAALEALRQSTFGSLLGDKAAEMSATFGDWSSLTSLPSFKR